MSKKSTKRHFKKLNERSLKVCKKLGECFDEYNEETNIQVDFHIFFVEVLMYSEEDYIKLITYTEKQKARKERNKKAHEFPKPRKINQSRLIELGIGDTANPEYKKYLEIFTDYNENYLGNTSITGKKTLKSYFIYKYNYSEDNALKESRKISAIIFKKNK